MGFLDSVWYSWLDHNFSTHLSYFWLTQYVEKQKPLSVILVESSSITLLLLLLFFWTSHWIFSNFYFSQSATNTYKVPSQQCEEAPQDTDVKLTEAPRVLRLPRKHYNRPKWLGSLCLGGMLLNLSGNGDFACVISGEFVSIGVWKIIYYCTVFYFITHGWLSGWDTLYSPYWITLILFYITPFRQELIIVDGHC